MKKSLIIILHLFVLFQLSSCSTQAVESSAAVEDEPVKQSCGRNMTQRSKCKNR